MNRREFLKHSAKLGAIAMAAAGPARLVQAASPTSRRKATADNVVLLWMGGGVAQTETFDPKPMVTFEQGMDARRVLTTYPSIPTALPGVQFCEGLENIGAFMDRGTLIRSFVAARSLQQHTEQVNHLPCQYLFHTGYRPPQTVAAPHIGSMLANILGPRNPDVPAFINIAQAGEVGGKAASDAQNFVTAGFLGSAYGPLSIPDPARAHEVLHPLLKDWRFQDRQKAFRRFVDASAVEKEISGFQRDSMLESMESAYRLIKSPAAKAFDIADESADVQKSYGISAFGRGCLLARRLVEAGSRFVEVHVAFDNARGWDHHDNGHTAVAEMRQLIDRPVAQLLGDLETRGLLDNTLVILASEFGRASLSARFDKAEVVKDMKGFGLNNHHGGAGAILAWGGGFRRGHLHGETANEFPCSVVRDPVFLEDLHATFFTTLGISPEHYWEVERRPFYVTRDGVGKPLTSLLG
jgi:hypothetical protein